VFIFKVKEHNKLTLKWSNCFGYEIEFRRLLGDFIYNQIFGDMFYTQREKDLSDADTVRS